MRLAFIFIELYILLFLGMLITAGIHIWISNAWWAWLPLAFPLLIILILVAIEYFDRRNDES